ncbi:MULTISPECIES: CsbD family protein [Streptomyces]|uniref:CsbD family protein n=2 Tax=Streptomyces rimosus subsp. rimosus TaxID=132474 RepID=L8ED35_STRR1|nr:MULTISPECIES: CsbD family protein [Streptomyces]KOG72357.1 general stress protein CsbD [Kitasatospora aureofaciens]MYT43803.1 CsbD family protein [Streptomyces sp. SID5471]KEF03134.1 general stress protein CsbD [Streptomyces rimosus]KEF22277.1 general stress protein CsbD [Streptomyces rimosus]KOT27340.1 general stress protein CsbD [Streptomyces rimosus subsp. rimosus]
MGDESAMDKVKGKAKEMAGKATGDDRMKSEGKTDRAKGKAKGAMDEAKENAQGMRDSLKGKGDRRT